MDKEALLAPRGGREIVELSIGNVVVRGLTRGEVMRLRKATDSLETLDGPRALVIERGMLAMAMVDPGLSEDEAKMWQENSPAGEIDTVMAVIQRLSGMEDGAKRAAYKSV